MLFRLLAIIALYIPVYEYAYAASVAGAKNNSPEHAITEFYRLASFEAGSHPDYRSIRSLLSDDAAIVLSTRSDSVELIGADESIERIRQKVDEIGFEEFGISFTPEDIDCNVHGSDAYCVTVVEVNYPGLDAKPVITKDLTTLEIQDGRWLATSSALFVTVPDIARRSILSYPVIRKDAPRVTGQKYDRALPLRAQSVIDLGYDLPRPFGISIIPVMMRQDMSLTDLDISINNGPVSSIDFVDFATPSAESNTLQVKLDAWLFPFMNIFGSFGWIEGGANVPVIFKGDDFLDAIGLGARCDGGPLQPELCVRTIAGVAKPSYRGKSFTVGGTLATGWKKMFAVLPFSYTWTDLEGKDDSVEAYNISPRLGVTSDIGNWGAMSTYIGASYLDSTNVVTDTLVVDTSNSGVPELGDTATLDYKINQTNKNKWNYLIGFSWNISRAWSAQAEAGFGGTRSNFISSVTYRY